MPTLEISEEQASFLDALRDAIEDELVGPYGTVERDDALQYLIDNYGEPDELLGDEGSAAAAAEDDDPEADSEDSDGDDGSSDADESDTEEATDEPNADDETDADAADDDEADTSGSTPTPPTPGGGGGDGMLDEMMSLMETHDDKWEKADSEETRYEVELPDGDTETVQTQDDVRALLFKNYR